MEGRLVKDGVRKTLQARQKAIRGLINAIREYRKLSEQPVTLRGSDYAHAVFELNKAIDRADNLIPLLMERLDIHDVAGLVRYAMRVGLVPPEEGLQA